MFNLSGSEIVVILLLALVVLGPDKLPEAMRKAGKTWAELRKLSSGFQEEVRKGFDEPTTEVRQTANAIKKAATLPKNPVKGAVKSLLEPPKTATAIDTTAAATTADATATSSAEAAVAAEVAATIDAEVDAAAVGAEAPTEPTTATPTESTEATPTEQTAATPPEPTEATPTESTGPAAEAPAEAAPGADEASAAAEPIVEVGTDGDTAVGDEQAAHDQADATP